MGRNGESAHSSNPRYFYLGSYNKLGVNFMSMQDRLFGMLDQGHDNLLLRFGLGKALTEDGQADQAITHLLKAVEFDETHASSWFWLGRAYLDDEQYDQAEQAFEQANTFA